MKINPRFKLRKVAGEALIVHQGQPGVEQTRIISLNASAALLFERLSEREFTLEDVTRLLTETYGICEEDAQRDAVAWVSSLQACQVLENS